MWCLRVHIWLLCSVDMHAWIINGTQKRGREECSAMRVYPINVGGVTGTASFLNKPTIGKLEGWRQAHNLQFLFPWIWIVRVVIEMFVFNIVACPRRSPQGFEGHDSDGGTFFFFLMINSDGGTGVAELLLGTHSHLHSKAKCVIL